MILKRRSFQTPLGEVWLWGEASAYDESSSRPVVLMIGGAFQGQPNAYLTELPPRARQADLLFTHLPGNNCPELREVSTSAYARALDYVVSNCLAGRSVLLLGISVGGLVAAAMRAREVRALLLIDPPFTAKAWPLTMIGRQALKNRAPHETWVLPFVENVFGVYDDRVEERPDLEHFLSTALPATIILASDPLMPEREITELPTLTDEPTREMIAARPNTKLIVAEGNHAVDLNIVLHVLRRCLAAL